MLCDDEFSNSKSNCSTRAVSYIKQLTTVAMFSTVIKKVNKVVFYLLKCHYEELGMGGGINQVL